MDTKGQWLPLFSGSAPDSWRARHEALFPSNDSLRHYFRLHKAELVKSGAVVFHRGQYVATEKLLPVVEAIARRAAQRAVNTDRATIEPPTPMRRRRGAMA